jgi:putative hydrolase of HD superfamily
MTTTRPATTDTPTTDPAAGDPPLTDPGAAQEAHTVGYLYELGLLKRSRRTGWWLAGIKDPESVAEHTFRTAVIGYALAVLEGANPERTAALCLFHDTPEARTGDIPSVGRAYVRAAPDTRVVADQMAGSPPALGQAIRGLIASYEARDSREAELAHDADKLECLLQAREYQAQGHADTEPWIVSSAAAVKSLTAQRLARAAQEVPPQQWWRAFVDSHNQHRHADGPGAVSLDPGAAAH